MSSVKCQKYVMKAYFTGHPKEGDLEIVEETLPPLKDGEYLCQAEWLSVDPYMRGFSQQLPLGSTMIGSQVAKVIESKNKDYAVGEYVVARLGWRTHTIVPAEGPGTPDYYKLDPSIPENMRSLGLGALGMPGATAYFAFQRICKPKEGETLVVNGAAGAVGFLVGQIAKIMGCRVVGFAGSDSKVEYLKSMGFDAVFNYKTIPSLDAALKEGCPKGIDMFFDNVGGEFFNTTLANMNDFGRVAVCGAISEYNLETPLKVSTVSGTILLKQLTVQGFIVWRWLDEWPEAFKQNRKWIEEGKLKVKEDVTEGFDNMYKAFMGLFKGENFGKAVVKA